MIPLALSETTAMYTQAQACEAFTAAGVGSAAGIIAFGYMKTPAVVRTSFFCLSALQLAVSLLVSPRLHGGT